MVHGTVASICLWPRTTGWWSRHRVC